MGSIMPTKMASMAGTYFNAVVYMTYGIPNWNTPKKNIMIQSLIRWLCHPSTIKGRQINAVIPFPNKTISYAPSFSFLKITVTRAKQTPATNAMILPQKPVKESSSIKNNPIPIKIMAITPTSRIVTFSFKMK